jgi:hypothetical protein
MMRRKMMHLDSVKEWFLYQSLRIWPLERIWCLKFSGLVFTSRLSVRIEQIYVYSCGVKLRKSFVHNNVQLCQFLSLVKFCEMWTWASCLEWLRMIWLHTSLAYCFCLSAVTKGHHFLDLNLSASRKVMNHDAKQSWEQIRHSQPRHCLELLRWEGSSLKKQILLFEHTISCKLNPLFGFLASSGSMSVVIESSGSLISMGLPFCH